MSQHPSLRVDSVGAKHRNVLKRFERVKKLDSEGKWEGESSIYNLPKIKSMKIKVKKGGGKGPKEEEGAAGAAAPAAGAAKAGAAKGGAAPKK